MTADDVAQASILDLLPRLHYFDEGTCIVHHIFGAETTSLVRKAYSDALLTAHFEVAPSVVCVLNAASPHAPLAVLRCLHLSVPRCRCQGRCSRSPWRPKSGAAELWAPPRTSWTSSQHTCGVHWSSLSWSLSRCLLQKLLPRVRCGGLLIECLCLWRSRARA